MTALTYDAPPEPRPAFEVPEPPEHHRNRWRLPAGLSEDDLGRGYDRLQLELRAMHADLLARLSKSRKRVKPAPASVASACLLGLVCALTIALVCMPRSVFAAIRWGWL